MLLPCPVLFSLILVRDILLNSPKLKLFFPQVIHETVPIPLEEGHQHEIECLHSADNLVVSLCLGGKIYTWDSQTGEKYSEMDRSR